MTAPILIATSNAGKLRDFSGAAAAHGIQIEGLPGFNTLPLVEEDGLTFEANARKKAEAYSAHAPGRIVIADDSGLSVDALNGAPGLHSARYAAGTSDVNADDAANNAKLLRELAKLPNLSRTARFICVIAAARDGNTLATFTGEVTGEILTVPRGSSGFGYDPLFFIPEANQTFAEMNAEEKAKYSHRGAAFRKFLDWYEKQRSHAEANR
jgi:XTP/dITP diphosphohydrolase